MLPSSQWRAWAPVAALSLAFFLQGVFSSRQKSPATDEPNHIVSGATYIATRTIVANPQHPPLLKELAGLSLALAGIRWQNPLHVPLDHLSPGWEWPVGIKFLTNAGVGRALFWARLPLLLLGLLEGLLLYWWGRELAGAAAGLGALFLFAADPTMVAHSYLVTTDAGVAAFSLLFLAALFRYFQKPVLARLAPAGVALGLALCSKFSAIFLLPIAAVLLLANWLWPLPGRKGAARQPLTSLVSDMALLLLAAALVTQVCYFSLRGPLLYDHGLRAVYADKSAVFRAFLGGRLKSRFPSYFAAAWLLKEPLATIALALAGAFLALRSPFLPRLVKLFLFLPPLVFFLACTLWAENIGIRYEMPAMIFGYLLGGIALAELWKRRALGRAAAAGACIWVGIAAAGIYPDHLSYFNEAACLPSHADRIGFDGGSRCGPDWLADSNVDWGESLPQLKDWLDRNAAGRPVRILNFGIFPPGAYGIEAEDANSFLGPVPPPGIYAISAHWVAYQRRMQPDTAWIQGDPDAIVGHAFYIFEF